MNRKTGRLPHDPAFVAALPKLADFATDWSADGVDWSRDMPADAWDIYLNDSLGDCTAAAAAHAVMTFGSYGRLPYTPLTNADVSSLYQATGGYVPGKPDTDRGALCTDVLQWWIGNPVGERRLSAFATVDPKNLAHIKGAVTMFGGVYAGVRLSQQQVDGAGDYTWTADPSADLGHCIWIVAANDTGLRCVTWGMVQDMTWDFWSTQADESYALVHPLWTGSGRTPDGFKTQDLISAMANI